MLAHRGSKRGVVAHLAQRGRDRDAERRPARVRQAFVEELLDRARRLEHGPAGALGERGAERAKDAQKAEVGLPWAEDQAALELERVELGWRDRACPRRAGVLVAEPEERSRRVRALSHGVDPD